MPLPLVLTGEFRPSDRHEEPSPRQDYVEIAKRLGVEVHADHRPHNVWSRHLSWLEASLRLDLWEPLRAAGRASQYSVVLSTSERVAIPLAAALALRRKRLPHVVIAHKLSSGGKVYLLRLWRLHMQFSRLICLCRSQADYAIRRLDLPPARVICIDHSVDQQFFSPLPVKDEGYLLAVGQEQRDFQTLMRAVAGARIKTVIVASGAWSRRPAHLSAPHGVTILSHVPYRELRELYGRARIVAVPLLDVDYAAGVNSLLEAMAMAKAVIVSRTTGIADYSVDGQTAVQVTPGNVEQLRNAIVSLWDRPTERERLGRNARRAVEERFCVDIYAQRVAHIVCAASTTSESVTSPTTPSTPAQ